MSEKDSRGDGLFWEDIGGYKVKKRPKRKDEGDTSEKKEEDERVGVDSEELKN